jgi:uncharacterized protein YyaL (SSP411 family)
MRFFCILLLFSFSCNHIKNPDTMAEQPASSFPYTNHLIHERSPYLLQHAHNPVDWYAWGDEALEKARGEDKLLLISIGYSACHWCHVMEHESFEDTAVARIMNDHFICIKVDREERPDIDQIYMNAVQLMKGNGGWPLNCFALPDGRPVYGGTYFPKAQWQKVLLNLADLYKNDRQKTVEYAEKLTAGIQQSELIIQNTNEASFSNQLLRQMVDSWKDSFDSKEGGPNHAPKFPLPNNYAFLLRYAVLQKDDEVQNHVLLTLHKMAEGGIYDQLGGGFARYATDSLWKIPHFEKMLYDNAQLISLYTDAWQLTKDPLYKEVVFETLGWISREMTSNDGAFYSALDADSEGKEGKYYTWTKEELQSLLKDDFDLFADYFNVNETGYWEEGQYILLRKKTDPEIAAAHGLEIKEMQSKMAALKHAALSAREKRVHPGLDDKVLTAWNAMMIRAYADAYRVFGNEEFLNSASKAATFIMQHQLQKGGSLNHAFKNGTSYITGFLDDYAFVADAFISLYEVTFDEQWLFRAKEITDYALEHFYDKTGASGMFYFTADNDTALIARKMEVQDNVIPASNSVMANDLFLLGHYLGDEEYFRLSTQMLNNVRGLMTRWGSSHSNWGILFMKHAYPFYEVAIAGEKAGEIRKELNAYFLPNKILMGTVAHSDLPLMEEKFVPGKTLIYVCENKTCQLPVSETSAAVKQMQTRK